MAKFSWLQFSDLHFTGIDSVGTSESRKKMGEFLKANIKECDYVFITGDVAHQANYAEVERQMKELAKCINYSTEKIGNQETFFWTVGNHDIKRVSEKTEIIQEVRKSQDLKRAYDNAMVNEAKSLLLGRLGYNDYFKAIKELSTDKSVRANMNHLGTHNQEFHRIIELPDVNLIILNTCLLSCDDKDEGKLFVMDVEFEKEFEKKYSQEKVKKMIRDKKPTFILAHHGKGYIHPDEYKRLVERFAGKVDLYLCGHSHELLYEKFYDPEEDAIEQPLENVIHQYTCGIGTLNGEDSTMTFLHGQYSEGKIKITTYCYDGTTWSPLENGKIRSNVEILRFKIQYKLKKNNFKLYVTGAQGVGKTAITKRLLNILENTEALQVAEVDFLKDAFRKDIIIKEEKLESVFKKNTVPEGNELAKQIREQTDLVLGERDLREAMLDSSYDHSIEELNKQSMYLFPRLMNAIERHTEKGIPAIIEGLNIPIEQLIEFYREKEKNEKDFNMDSIMIINLSVDSKNSHEERMRLRIKDRQLDGEEAEKQLSYLDNIYNINKHYIDATEKMIIDNPDMHIYNIDNSGRKDKYTVAMEIVDLIAQSQNFID